MISQIRLARHQELVRLGIHERLPLLLREAEAHDLLVAREGQENDPAYPELRPVADQYFVGARQLAGNSAHVVDRDHEPQPAAYL